MGIDVDSLSPVTSRAVIPLLTAQDVRAAVILKDANRENELMGLGESVTQLWERATNRLWAERVGYTEVFSIAKLDDLKLWPRLLPITGEVAVTEWWQASGETTAITTDPGDYEVDPVTASVKLTRDTPTSLALAAEGFVDPSRPPSWADRVRVTYDGGVAAADLAAQYPLVRRALMIQVAFEFQRLDPTNLAIRSRGGRGGSVSFESSDLHPYFARAAEMYTRHV